MKKSLRMKQHIHTAQLAACCLAASCCAQLTFAQTNQATDTSMVRKIEIVRDYNPTIKEASKINTMPELKDETTKKMDVNYSIWATPVNPTSDSVPALDYALAEKTGTTPQREGYLRLGGGNYTSFLGEAYVPVWTTKVNKFSVYGKHNSSFGKVRLTSKLYEGLADDFRVKATTNENFLKADYAHNFKRGRELSAYADFGYNGFNYYGYDMKEQSNRDVKYAYDRDQAFTNFDAGLRFRSKHFIDKWSYDGQTNYQLFHTQNGLNEHTILTKLGGKYIVDNGHLGVDLEMSNIFLGLPTDSFPFDFNKSQNTNNETVIIVKPAYVAKGKNSMLNIGVKGAFCFGQGRPASVMPDIWGNIAINPQYWYLYAGVTGDMQINSYRNMAQENRYIALDNRAEDTYVPIDVYFGSKVNVMKKVLLDLNVGYKVINNPYFFVNKQLGNELTVTAENDSINRQFYGSFYDLVYGSKEGLFTIGWGITSQFWHEKAEILVKGKYNKWALNKNETAWMKPEVELLAQLSVMPVKDLRMYVAYNLVGGRKALVNDAKISMNNVSDLSIGADYKVLSWLNIFARANNILSNEYDRYYYGYASQHFNILGGLSLIF